MRYASTRYDGAPVDTNRPTVSPRCALTRSVKPRTLSHAAGSPETAQSGVPGLAFSSTIVALAAGRGGDDPGVAAARSSTPEVTSESRTATVNATVATPMTVAQATT